MLLTVAILCEKKDTPVEIIIDDALSRQSAVQRLSAAVEVCAQPRFPLSPPLPPPFDVDGSALGEVRTCSAVSSGLGQHQASEARLKGMSTPYLALNVDVGNDTTAPVSDAEFS